ncbi:RidA family protein [Azospirillum picis]|uniref:Enamine deaminase RidA (YjgF/YER057c/UK114 family) n=1 Tax=Azospirillum picis TaxID=488438 RepID=A0ABU0MME6_9PROT|nr:RidA family protein [Azospirillum picis]MBP2300671.1 enamine deaminase RidA (YjgF/YER057c/UK114 family) [Azospirillum picis]MDQ0534640.1 enamine deaminase RidA (YjgF/YER057c/UK114 family) [Azospirillum picis]
MRNIVYIQPKERTVSDIVRIETDKRRSRAVIYNGMVFIGGQTADDRSQDIRGQTQQTLAKIEKFLAQADTDKSRLLTAQIWIKNLARDFDAMNEVWNAWTAPNAAPTRATAQCEMGAPDVLVEIIVTAAIAPPTA